MNRNLLFLAMVLLTSLESHAIIIIPIPNLAFPGALGKIRDAFEKSTDTKALATAGEDKLFGSRQWVWGHASGKMTQSDANDQAMRKCEASLSNAKGQLAGGQSLYNFGSNRCELYKFLNVTLSLPEPTAPPAPAPVQSPAPAPVVSQLPLPVATPMQTEPQAFSVTPSAPAAANSAPVQSQTFQQSQSKGNTDIVQKMKDLDTLFKQSLITQGDYEHKKKQLLDAM